MLSVLARLILTARVGQILISMAAERTDEAEGKRVDDLGWEEGPEFGEGLAKEVCSLSQHMDCLWSSLAVF